MHPRRLNRRMRVIKNTKIKNTVCKFLWRTVQDALYVSMFVLLKIKLNRTEYGVHVPANKTILDAALDNKVKIPFSCGSGICATCLCKVENGEVKMVGKHSLSEKDMKRGYILACISYAASPEIVIKVE